MRLDHVGARLLAIPRDAFIPRCARLRARATDAAGWLLLLLGLSCVHGRTRGHSWQERKGSREDGSAKESQLKSSQVKSSQVKSVVDACAITYIIKKLLPCRALQLTAGARPAARSRELATDHGRPRSEGKRKGPAKREGKVALWQVPRPVVCLSTHLNAL